MAQEQRKTRELRHEDLKEGLAVIVTEESALCIVRGRNCVHREAGRLFLYCREDTIGHRNRHPLLSDSGDKYPLTGMFIEV